jgi:hypothetical protein
MMRALAAAAFLTAGPVEADPKGTMPGPNGGYARHWSVMCGATVATLRINEPPRSGASLRINGTVLGLPADSALNYGEIACAVRKGNKMIYLSVAQGNCCEWWLLFDPVTFDMIQVNLSDARSLGLAEPAQ